MINFRNTEKLTNWLLGSQVSKEEHGFICSTKVFKRATILSFSLYICTVFFFIFWVLGQSRETTLILNSNLFSRTFFFLNPHLFHKVFVDYRGLNLLSGATDFQSFLFLTSYICTFLSFIVILIIAFWLFIISYYTSIRTFHYISCLSVLPIISSFLITWFIIKLVIFTIDNKLQKASKFQDDFVPEVFEDNVSKSDPLYLSKRPITEEFNFAQYKKNYRPIKRSNIIKDWYSRLDNYLS